MNSQSLKIFSNGEDLVLVLGDFTYVAKGTMIRNCTLDVKQGHAESSFFGNHRNVFIPTSTYTNIDLSLSVMELKHYRSEEIDIDQLLFKNKTILETLKVVRDKVKEREK